MRDEHDSYGAGFDDGYKEGMEVAQDKIAKAVDFCLRLERFAKGTNDQFLLDRCREILGELTDARHD